MPLVIQLSADEEASLEQRAATRGQEPSEYARTVLLRDLERQTLDEILAPFRKEVEESGMTDDELDALFEEAREEVWREKQDRARG